MRPKLTDKQIWQREEAVRLREEGLSYKDIGEVVGTSDDSVHKWLNPEIACKKRETKRKLANEHVIREWFHLSLRIQDFIEIECRSKP